MARVPGTPAVRRRPEIAADAEFRIRLFQAAQDGLFAGLDPALADLLRRQQCAAQDAAYRAAFPGGRFDIVERDGAPVGRIVTAVGPDVATLVDLALLPEARGHGLGSGLIAALIDEARAEGLPVRLSVGAGNAGAQRLYRRLGFRFVAGSDGVVLPMVWTPDLALGAVPDAVRLPLAFDADAMAAECTALARGDWNDHFVRRNYDGAWSVIPLRAPAEARHPVMMIQSDPGARDYVDTPFLAACPAIRTALARFGCPLLSVRLMRLGPGSRIKEHRDPDLSFEEGAVRLHVPLITHDGVVFSLNRRRVVMAAGSCWYLRLSDPHAVENPGPGERFHLVIDAPVTPALAALFADASAAAA